MYEIFEHTADLGLRVRAADLNGLLEDAARGLFSILVVNLHDVQPVVSRGYQLPADEPQFLLFDWLNELLYTFESERLLWSRFDVQISRAELNAVSYGEPMDLGRHQMHHEIKAITYHALKVQQTDNSGWLAEVIVDI